MDARLSRQSERRRVNSPVQFTVTLPCCPSTSRLYVVGMLVGPWRPRSPSTSSCARPGSRELIGLVMLVLLLWGAISITHTPFTDMLLPMVWGGTGLLAGFGSRELHTAS